MATKKRSNGNGNGCFKVEEGDVVEIKGDVIIFFRNGKEVKRFDDFKYLIHKLYPYEVEENIIRKVIISLISGNNSLTTKLIWNQDQNAEKENTAKYNIVKL
uniref:Uncharacterized protein n=1 Tax=candidate division CPR3 bacterium TaxID=2268181 RepID=A0A7C4M513_UNCC3